MSLIYKQTVNAKLLECNSIISMFGNFLGNGVLLSFQRFELVRQLFLCPSFNPLFFKFIEKRQDAGLFPLIHLLLPFRI